MLMQGSTQSVFPLTCDTEYVNCHHLYLENLIKGFIVKRNDMPHVISSSSPKFLLDHHVNRDTLSCCQSRLPYHHIQDLKKLKFHIKILSRWTKSFNVFMKDVVKL